MHYIVLYYLISFILDGRFSMKGSPLSNIKYLHIAVHHVRSSTGEETKKARITGDTNSVYFLIYFSPITATAITYLSHVYTPKLSL